jgi:hypothetical protein
LFLLVAQRSCAKEPVEMIAANPRPRHGTHPDKATDGFFSGAGDPVSPQFTGSLFITLMMGLKILMDKSRYSVLSGQNHRQKPYK